MIYRMTPEEFDTARIVSMLSGKPIYTKLSRTDFKVITGENEVWVWYEAIFRNCKYHTFAAGGNAGYWIHNDLEDNYLAYVRNGGKNPKKYDLAKTLVFEGFCTEEDLPIPFDTSRIV